MMSIWIKTHQISHLTLNSPKTERDIRLKRMGSMSSKRLMDSRLKKAKKRKNASVTRSKSVDCTKNENDDEKQMSCTNRWKGTKKNVYGRFKRMNKPNLS